MSSSVGFLCKVSLVTIFMQTLCSAHASPCLDARCQSAAEIIGDCHRFETNAAQFHQDAETLIAQATKLKGQAHFLQTKVPILPQAAKMSAAEYALGAKQYGADLAEFSSHAQAYQEHLKQFQSTIGECHAHAAALDNVLKKYEIHVGEFHINSADIRTPQIAKDVQSTPEPAFTIRPPHICRKLQVTVDRDFKSIANQMVADQMRVLRAEGQLRLQEADLQNAEQASAVGSIKAIDRAKREENEQALVSEFGRLQIEYELLKSEKDRLVRANAKGAVGRVTQSLVSGKISH